MKMDAMRRQGARVDVEGTCGNNCHKLGIKTADIVGDTVGLKGRQVRNYVRLTYLSPELLEMVDQKKIQFVIAVDLSYLDEQIQKWVYTVFVCVIVAVLGGCWKTYDTEAQRNMVMLICFGVTALLGIISWCGSIKRDEN